MDRMVEIATSELVGAALDWAVGKAQGWVVYPTDSIEQGYTWHLDSQRAPFGQTMRVADWQPSTRWAQGGALIEKYEVGIERLAAGWFAEVAGSGKDQYDDVQPLMVVCRAIVAATLGDTVSVPAELLENA